MANMAGSVYDALISVGVSHDKARAAAEEVVTRDKDLGDLKADVAVLKWMMGAMIALQFILLGSFFGFAINHATFH